MYKMTKLSPQVAKNVDHSIFVAFAPKKDPKIAIARNTLKQIASNI